MVSWAQDESTSSVERQNKHRQKREKSEKSKTSVFQITKGNLQRYACQVGVIMTLICFIMALVIEAEVVMTTIIKFIFMDIIYYDMIEKSLNKRRVTPAYPHSFASSLLIFHCTMLLHSVISWILGMKYCKFL